MDELKVINEQVVLEKEFRMYGDMENPLFLAKDVANWIEHNKPNEMIKNIDEDEKLKAIITHSGQGREMWFLTEDGLYEVLMQSRKPIAKQFKKKVKEILKGLRKGNLQIVSTKEDELVLAIYHSTGIDAVNKAKELSELKVREATQPLLDKIEEDKPKVTFADRVLRSKDNILVRQLAKIASDEGYKIGERKLYNKLREWGYVLKGSTEPSQRAIDSGYFVIKVSTIDTPYGIKETKTTLVTPKGQIKIVEKLLKELNE